MKTENRDSPDELKWILYVVLPFAILLTGLLYPAPPPPYPVWWTAEMKAMMTEDPELFYIVNGFDYD